MGNETKDSNMARLKFAIPATGFESGGGFMDSFPVVLNAEEAVLTVLETFTKAELVAALGTVFPIVSAVIGQWFSLGAGYAAARAEVAKKNMIQGFSLGVVMSADGRKAELLRDYFWKFSPINNPFDEEAGKIAQNANNQGLVAGFMQGRELNKEQQAWLWRDIGRSLGDQSRRGESNTWNTEEWQEWYIAAAAKFQLNHLSAVES